MGNRHRRLEESNSRVFGLQTLAPWTTRVSSREDCRAADRTNARAGYVIAKSRCKDRVPFLRHRKVRASRLVSHLRQVQIPQGSSRRPSPSTAGFSKSTASLRGLVTLPHRKWPERLCKKQPSVRRLFASVNHVCLIISSKGFLANLKAG